MILPFAEPFLWWYHTTTNQRNVFTTTQKAPQATMNDRDAMERAYEVARSARANGNHPFGAVLVLWTARLSPRPKTQCTPTTIPRATPKPISCAGWVNYNYLPINSNGPSCSPVLNPASCVVALVTGPVSGPLCIRVSRSRLGPAHGCRSSRQSHIALAVSNIVPNGQCLVPVYHSGTHVGRTRPGRAR